MTNRESDYKIAEDLNKKITSEFIRCFLIKPLTPKKVKVEYTEPLTDKKETTDDNGVSAKDYSKVEKKQVEADAEYREGIVIKVPVEYKKTVEAGNAENIKPGDKIIYHRRSATNFDLYKDSILIYPYDIVAIGDANW